MQFLVYISFTLANTITARLNDGFVFLHLYVSFVYGHCIVYFIENYFLLNMNKWSVIRDKMIFGSENFYQHVYL